MSESKNKMEKKSPRGEQTRLRLIEEGGRLFARKGFDGVSTRDIAGACGVNLASIAYHFGGKEGLYHAVLEDILGNMQEASEPLVASVQQGIVEADGDADVLAKTTWQFIYDFLVWSLGNRQNYWAVDFLQREILRGHDVLDRFYTSVIGPVYDAGSDLCHAASGNSLSREERVMQGHTLVSMCMGFVRAQHVVLRRMGWETFTPERACDVARSVASSALSMLGLPYPDDLEGTLPAPAAS